MGTWGVLTARTTTPTAPPGAPAFHLLHAPFPIPSSTLLVPLPSPLRIPPLPLIGNNGTV